MTHDSTTQTAEAPQATSTPRQPQSRAIDRQMMEAEQAISKSRAGRRARMPRPTEAGKTGGGAPKPPAEPTPGSTTSPASAPARPRSPTPGTGGSEPNLEAPEPTEPKPERYLPDGDQVTDIAQRLAAARTNGIGQSRIAEVAGIMPFAVWRAERRHQITATEIEPLLDALAKIDAGEVQPRRSTGTRKAAGTPTLRGRLDEREERIAKAAAVLASAAEPATKAELRRANDEALAVLLTNPREATS